MEFSTLLPPTASEAMQGNSSYEQAASVRPGNHENLHCIEDASAAEHDNSVEDAISKVGQAFTGVVESVFDAGCVIAVKPGSSNIILRGIVFKPGRYDNPVEDAISKVGQAFTGVVESVFDAGCVIAVKLGNSNITLRGVVFKPGRYTPVTAENDVAPGLRYIRGNETHLAKQNRSHPRQRRTKERHQRTADYLGTDSSAKTLGDNLLSTRQKRTAVGPSVPLVGTRGTVVPVVLEPGNAAVAAQTANMAPPKGKNVQTVSRLSTVLKLPAPHLSQFRNL